MLRLSDDLQIGKAGEYLVCFDLIMKGFVAYPSEQGLLERIAEKSTETRNSQ